MMQEFITEYGVPLITTILTAVFSYIGMRVKNAYEKFINDKTKKAVVDATVNYVEMVFKALDGETKLDMAITNASTLLIEKGIKISELELRVLIEACCNSFRKGNNDGQ